ncbi:Alpha-1,4-glucan:maltose-1-phosphate maltosyltransferase [Pseudoalteromonas holothuriae]|uniref:Alpha-1,4-glucan:maltose-1-phosphate maltosyltransferase n=1 Tax=Pseudoalteromonas holothuriae TaxID=2963714 RepID=A0ABN8UK46_9GAMM|nr:alpha-amylase family glycosyl hydrolase [Pseudoalteromonas sp. CIP111951]CAH9057331.1 Alpha-1,4-glucan:maltose-1-phosphate maltosyltransferase [Pseudoalteromonas sp. CIP111951]
MINKKAKSTTRVLKRAVVGVMCSSLLVSCSEHDNHVNKARITELHSAETQVSKPVVYQVFTRLFGNKKTANIPWGTVEQNGVGKFADFSPKALQEIKALGTTHIWYTGVLHHALVTDHSKFGIAADDPDVVKGRAGSPYAVKDYYNVNPDLATDPSQRLAEFDALIARTHKADMKVIIDIVPNHVARNYQSLSAPQGVADFGANDDTTKMYARDNNFYYVVGQDFKVPKSTEHPPLGGQHHPRIDGQFVESPAKWTGNGARAAAPDIDDWYETVKVNYGVKPDGSYDFPKLPDGFETKSVSDHYKFWQQHDLPDSWYKFRDITQYWLNRGVDGFRYDMAEMVPVEFWSFLNASIKMQNPEAFLLAEVYNPALYRDYIQKGKMDYLYDKVGFYDSLKALMQQTGSAKAVFEQHLSVSDIATHMLHFLENHDEQRIASAEFAGDARMGKPAMVVSHLISKAPSMLYFGQTVGEDGSEQAGFGKPSRTSIFDYIGVPAHQAWMNGGKFDGGQLSEQQGDLRAYYVKLMSLSTMPAIVAGDLLSVDLEADNIDAQQRVMAFARSLGNQKLVVASNFDAASTHTVSLQLPKNWQQITQLTARDLLEQRGVQIVQDNQITITLAPRASVVYLLED